MKTKSIAILTMGLAMLSMDGMAQTTRQEYKDILDIQLTPGLPAVRTDASRIWVHGWGSPSQRRRNLPQVSADHSASITATGMPVRWYLSLMVPCRNRAIIRAKSE